MGLEMEKEERERWRIPWPGCPSKAAELATIIMTPRSPSAPFGSLLAMCGRTWRIRSMVPRTLTFITKSKSSSEKGLRFRSRIWHCQLRKYVLETCSETLGGAEGNNGTQVRQMSLLVVQDGV